MVNMWIEPWKQGDLPHRKSKFRLDLAVSENATNNNFNRDNDDQPIWIWGCPCFHKPIKTVRAFKKNPRVLIVGS